MATPPTLLTALTLLLAATTTAPAQTVAPAVGQRFALPLADGTTGQAIILPGQIDHHFVWTTPTGQLGFATLNLEPSPIPPIPPIPPPPPTTLAIAIIEDPHTTTPLQRGILTDNAWRTAIPPPHTFAGIIPHDYLDPDTKAIPPHLAPFLAAAHGRTLPVVVQIAPDGSIVRLNQLPNTAQQLIALFPIQKGTPNATPDNRRPQLHNGHPRTPPTTRDPQTLYNPRIPATTRIDGRGLQTPRPILRHPLLCPPRR